jgi:hypothetical protein
MLQDENDSESVAVSAIDGVCREEAAHGNGGTAELRSIMSEETAPRLEFANHADGHRSVRELVPMNFFVSENWHRPYADALMETDPVRLAPLIAEAEHAIFDRYLELCVSPGPIEYSRDLLKCCRRPNTIEKCNEKRKSARKSRLRDEG